MIYRYSWPMKRVLVLGGAGFLGSNLCSALLDLNFHVQCIDNLSSGSVGNMQILNSNPNFTFLEHDVREKFYVEADVIVNMACPASPPRYQLNPVGTLVTNFQGTLNGLELAREIGARFIQASTSEIYGNPLIHPQVESYWGNVNPIGERSCYDEGKRAAETLCSDFRSQFRVSSTIVRIFNTYGPGMARDDGRVVSNFIVQALENRDITIYGDGRQSRSLCYVSDLIDGFVRIIESNEDIRGPINLGNPLEISMNSLAKKIIMLTKSKSKIVYKKLPSDDPERRMPDIALAKTTLDWLPLVSLEEGLTKTISYFAN
jgi:UDP-glucuronate decarboxylase